MMQVEFERLVGREVTGEQYKLIEELYMQSSLSKQDFAKSMKKVVKSLPRPRCSRTYTMAVKDRSARRTGATFTRFRWSCWMSPLPQEP